uniref:Tetraspanin n=1 Tax=Tetraodon nigroviridis TaxID=99883 RepID=H3C0H6_TETNG
MCCSGFLKVMMFIFNGIIFLAGCAVLGVGVWVAVDKTSFLGILDNVDGIPQELSQLIYVSYLLIALGCVLVVIGFLGCCGAIRESRCMLLTFFIIVLIIFLAEVAGAVVLFVFQDVVADLLMKVEGSVVGSIKKDYGSSTGVTSLWNSTMEQLDCCGFMNYTDFTGSPYYTSQGGIYPQYCCNVTISAFPCNGTDAQLSRVDGCYTKLVTILEENAVIVAGVAIGIAALEIAAMVVSMVLYNQIGRKA